VTPTTHLLASWLVADSFKLERRDRNLVTWCGLLPDLDGLGLAVDLANDVLGRPETAFYHIYHHSLLHGVAAAVLLPALAAAFARRRWLVFTLGVVVVHLHFLCDLLGSRGPAPTDLWSVPYLAPFSSHWTWLWTGQWRLDGWQNFAITSALLAVTLWRAVQRGWSPVSLFSLRADAAVVKVLRKWWPGVAPHLPGQGG
jgi:inner membrane protein